MARVKGKDTKPELLVRRGLWHAGIRYRLHLRDLPGRPDIAIARAKVAIFVHGCFWHRHPGCGGNRTPKSNVDFWRAKLDANVARDQVNIDALRQLGWTPLIIWECEARAPARLAEFVEEVKEAVNRPT